MEIFVARNEAADPVAAKLNDLIQTEFIPKNRILYRCLSDIVERMNNPDYQYHPDINNLSGKL